MAKRRYTPEYFERRSKMAEAKMMILKAMEQAGELTTVEWIAIFAEQITRMTEYEMSEEEGQEAQP